MQRQSTAGYVLRNKSAPVCRYANPSAQAIASQCEDEGMEVEGFNAVRLKAIQAKLAAEGGNPPARDIKQDNILNLPLPEFDLEGASPPAPILHLCASAPCLPLHARSCPLHKDHMRLQLACLKFAGSKGRRYLQ